MSRLENTLNEPSVCLGLISNCICKRVPSYLSALYVCLCCGICFVDKQLCFIIQWPWESCNKRLVMFCGGLRNVCSKLAATLVKSRFRISNWPSLHGDKYLWLWNFYIWRFICKELKLDLYLINFYFFLFLLSFFFPYLCLEGGKK